VSAEGSKLTVLLAGGANLVIATAKIAAGVATGSSAMLSEGAHSVADTLNQVFLMAALHRSGRPADSEHPFGYGMERYFWSLLAAVSIFVLGAGFSIRQGVSALAHPEAQTHLTVAFGVLAVALVFEGVSLVRGLVQTRQDARAAGESGRDQLMHGGDPTVRAVVFEDVAAVLGILLAALGLALDRLLGTKVFDGLASIAIGLLLVVVAWALGRQNMGYLVGRAVDRDVLDQMRAEIEATDGIERVRELKTMRLSPTEVLLAARVEVADAATGGRVELAAEEVDRRLQARFSDVVHVFLDPTPGDDVSKEGIPAKRSL
jgi:cation diffusion facilitator family transporter